MSLSESSTEAAEFNEPPEDLISYPENAVVALFDDSKQAAAAIDALGEAGIATSEVYVLAGPHGAERLDPTGRNHGISGRLQRLAEWMGGERELLERNAAHMAAGGLSMVVPADDETSETVAGVLRSCGGHHMNHFGTNTWTELGS